MFQDTLREIAHEWKDFLVADFEKAVVTICGCIRRQEGLATGDFNGNVSVVVVRLVFGYFPSMSDTHTDTTPAWVESSALAAPVILGAAAGLLVGNLMHSGARRGLGLGLGILGVAALLPFVVDGVADLITGPRSKFGVRRKIQKIRDIGLGSPIQEDEVDAELRERGVI